MTIYSLIQECSPHKEANGIHNIGGLEKFGEPHYYEYAHPFNKRLY